MFKSVLTVASMHTCLSIFTLVHISLHSLFSRLPACLLLLLSYTWWLVYTFLGNLAPLGSRDCEFLFPSHFLAIILLPVKEFILKLEMDENIEYCFSN